MATLEDKILGEKLEYYCSSSEDEDDDSFIKTGADSAGAPPPPTNAYSGKSSNTGPKGVLNDWQRFKQLETEQRLEDQRERINLAKKLSVTCTSHLDDEREKEAKENNPTVIDEDDVLMDEVFFKQYLQQRMQQMISTNNRLTFGKLVSLDSADLFLDAIDNEDHGITIVIHIYDQMASGCEAMNGALLCLAQEYPHVKFCRFLAKDAGVTDRFKGKGLPALLVYKGGQLVGNFVRLLDEFGDDFYATDVESYLIEHGVLGDKSLISPTIKSSTLTKSHDDDDSDYSLDS